MKVNSKIFYHYCSAKSFYEIVSTGQVWMADATKTNDSSEMVFLFEDFEQVFMNVYKKNKFPCILGNLENEEAINSIFNAGITYRNYNGENAYTNYVFCLSEKSNSLNQWRAYARNGSGFALGFYYEKLNEFAKNNPKFSLAKVKYLSKKSLVKIQIEYATTILNGIKDIFNLNRKAANLKTLLNNYVYHQFQIMAEDAVHYKSYDFSEEKEWRLIYKCKNKKEEIKIKDSTEFDSIQFYYKNEDIISFIPIKLSNLLVTNTESKLKNTLVLGPQNKVYVVDILMYLEKNGIHNVEIDKSEITYRSNFGNAMKN